jgi:DNA modification methylase
MTNPTLAAFRRQRKNANRHTDRGKALLQTSIGTDGFIGAITAAADGEVFAGSARLEKAAEVFGQGAEPLVIHTDGRRAIVLVRDDIPNADDPTAVRLAVADNQIHVADYDPDAELLTNIAEGDAGIRAMFSHDEWRRILAEIPVNDTDVEPQIELKKELAIKWRTAPGQLWQLGEHRLLIADSTAPGTYPRLLGAERVDQLNCDPPSGVDIGREHEFRAEIGVSSRVDGGEVLNDNIKDYTEFYTKFLTPIPFAPYNTVYVFMQGKRMRELRQAMVNAGIYFSESLVWVKSSHVLGRQDYNHKHEDIVYGWKGKHLFYNGFKTSVIDGDIDIEQLDREQLLAIVREFRRHLDVIREKKPNRSPLHPTMKPVALVAGLIKDGTKKGAIVLDPFGGSGTCMVACEDNERRCRMVEQDHELAAVILERWTALTGKTPGKIEAENGG